MSVGGFSAWQVVAAHKYEAEDDDELTFEKGELIHVVEFEDPEDQVSHCIKLVCAV